MSALGHEPHFSDVSARSALTPKAGTVSLQCRNGRWLAAAQSNARAAVSCSSPADVGFPYSGAKADSREVPVGPEAKQRIQFLSPDELVHFTNDQ